MTPTRRTAAVWLIAAWALASFTLGLGALAHGDAAPLVILAAITLAWSPELAAAIRRRRGAR